MTSGAGRSHVLGPRLILAIAVVAAVGTLALRWYGGWRVDASRFEPRPDALEYVAGAQAIARDGVYLLHVGPAAERPRYSPGFSMLLAVALEAGVAPTRLVRVANVADALLAFLVALGAGLGVLETRRALGLEPGTLASIAGAALAALVAGMVTALAWWHVLNGAGVLSDSWTAFVATCTLLAWLGLVWRVEPISTSRFTMVGLTCGVGLGVTCALRPIEGVLLAPILALAPLFHGRTGLQRAFRALPYATLGGALPVALVTALLGHSGLPVTEWSAYARWMPEGELTVAEFVDPRYFFEAARIGVFAGDPNWPGWKIASSAIFGIPRGMEIGRYWPVAGWIAAAIVARRAGRTPAGDSNARKLRGIIVVLSLWAALHVAFYGCFFFPAQRFYIAPSHSAILFSTAALGLVVSSRKLWARLGGIAAAGAIVAYALLDYNNLLRALPTSSEPALELEVARKYRQWRESSPQERRRRGPRFDPVTAQALGLLDGDSIWGLREWGPLPRTPHIVALEARGTLSPESLRRSAARAHRPQGGAKRRPPGLPIFEDGFESSSCLRWSVTVTAP